MPLPSGVKLVLGPPPLRDYLDLRRRSGLTPKTEEQGSAAIAGTWAFRHALDARGQVVAMGRVIGDGGWYFHIADMATLPSHQGRGLGGAILDSLLQAVRDGAPSGAYITLIADPPGRRLYESRGFRDLAGGQAGMHLPGGANTIG